jgi:tetratricopeptide (TPR) repeat protein
VTPASADVDELVRRLSLTDGFMLIPIEVAGPDVARALGASLAQAGWHTVVVEPAGDAQWPEIVARVLDAAATSARAVLVVGPARPTGGLYAALRLVNQRRDSIAEILARPLLWCGPADFLKLTWERAPDFWSIRAMTMRLTTLEHPVREAPLWPGAWVPDPPERLREMLAVARRTGDERNASRVAAALAEALVARGDLEEAAEVVAETRGAPSFRMVDAVVSAMRGERARAAAILGDSAWTSGLPELEGRRLVALGNLELDGDSAMAAARYAQARAMLHAAGDLANEAVAVANLGVVAMAQPGGAALDSAAALLGEALALARGAGDARTEARVLSKLGRVELLQRDSRRACTTLEEALARVGDAAGDPRVEAEVLRRLASAYLELGDPEKAEGDARRAADLARATGDDAGANEAEDIARQARDAMGTPG